MNASTPYNPIALLYLTLFVLTTIFAFIKFFIRYANKDTRIVKIKRPDDIKIYEAGWAFLNPLQGKTAIISLKKQSLEADISEETSEKIKIEYRIIDIEKAISIGIVQAGYLLKRADFSERKKIRMQQTGQFFDPIMFFISGFVQTMGIIVCRKTDKHEKSAIECKKELQTKLVANGIEIISFQKYS